jgi:hypothetical protein
MKMLKVSETLNEQLYHGYRNWKLKQPAPDIMGNHNFREYCLEYFKDDRVTNLTFLPGIRHQVDELQFESEEHMNWFLLKHL